MDSLIHRNLATSLYNVIMVAAGESHGADDVIEAFTNRIEEWWDAAAADIASRLETTVKVKLS